ncbi:MAG: type II toxin-antitoxin system RelB/DinJ family antitoxin [Candidatus Nomurabacteria bacterium]|jgi:DNA-damage-inducible protein J|nr:type II toxin-antitoxin system RelB/DinJ family antitoxin [Candidatus Nomurabacteria bacterium]
MANTELIQVRVDKKLKNDTEKIFKEIGFSNASAVRTFLKRVQREGDFPFDIRMFNDETVKTIRESDKGRKLSKKYKDVDKMMKDILGADYARA